MTNMNSGLFMAHHLNPEPARPLTPREIAKVLSVVLGGLAEWCDPADLAAAMAHFHANAAEYRAAWEAIHRTLRSPPNAR